MAGPWSLKPGAWSLEPAHYRVPDLAQDVRWLPAAHGKRVIAAGHRDDRRRWVDSRHGLSHIAV